MVLSLFKIKVYYLQCRRELRSILQLVPPATSAIKCIDADPRYISPHTVEGSWKLSHSMLYSFISVLYVDYFILTDGCLYDIELKHGIKPASSETLTESNPEVQPDVQPQMPPVFDKRMFCAKKVFCTKCPVSKCKGMRGPPMCSGGLMPESMMPRNKVYVNKDDLVLMSSLFSANQFGSSGGENSNPFGSSGGAIPNPFGSSDGGATDTLDRSVEDIKNEFDSTVDSFADKIGSSGGSDFNSFGKRK